MRRIACGIAENLPNTTTLIATFHRVAQLPAEELSASGLIPTFATLCSTRPSKCRNQRNTSKPMILVELLNLTFTRKPGRNPDSNVNSLH